MSSDEDIRLLGELENLLKKQIELARRGSFASVEKLALQADLLARDIGNLGVLDRPEHSVLRAELKRLYNELFVVLAGERSATAHQIKRLRRGKRTLEVYRKNT
jgi:hypothetical protein